MRSIHSERGFSLVEILIALVIFAMVAVGSITVIGAATAGGYLDVFPVSFATTRAARDYTAASVYLQTLQEFVASQGLAAGFYCTPAGSSPTCPTGSNWPANAPTPAGLPYQLNWREVDLLVQLWGWSDPNGPYTVDPSCTGDCLRLVQSTVYWEFKGQTRRSGGCNEVSGLACLQVRRFIR